MDVQMLILSCIKCRHRFYASTEEVQLIEDDSYEITGYIEPCQNCGHNHVTGAIVSKYSEKDHDEIGKGQIPHDRGEHQRRS